MALLALGACSNTLDPVGEDMRVTDGVAPPSLTPPSQTPKVYLAPANLSTNVPPDSISVRVEDSFIDRINLDGLASTIQLLTWPAGEPIEVTVRALEDDARGGGNVLRVEAPTLAEGWYQLRAGPLGAGLEWATWAGPGYALPDDEIASIRFRIGSEPRVSYVQVCAIGADRAKHKVYTGISETVRVTRPVAQHVLIRTAHGPTNCTSTQDQNTSGTLDYDTLNFVCDGLSEDDRLTVELTDAFAPIADPGRAAAASSEEFTFELAELLRFDDLCGFFVPDGDRSS
jgi:hypothetical protein